MRCGGDTERSRANKIVCCYRITLCVVLNHPDWHPNRISTGTRRKDGWTCCLRVLIRGEASLYPLTYVESNTLLSLLAITNIGEITDGNARVWLYLRLLPSIDH